MPSGDVQISLRAVDATNRRDCAAVQVAEDQRGFVLPVPGYLALCEDGGEWHPLAVYSGDQVTGFVMWTVRPEDRCGFIGGLTIDAGRQRQGIGRAALTAMVRLLREDQGCRSVALSYTADNAVARALYESLGFVGAGETPEGDRIARLRP